MLECLKFIFDIVAEFISMLFTIDLGDGLSLGVVMCVVFIFMPIILSLVDFLKASSGDVSLALFKRNKGGKE